MIIKQLNQLAVQPVSHNDAIKKRVLLTGGELPPITQLAEARFPPGSSAPAHLHNDMDEVFFVQAGRGRIVVDGSQFELTPGTMIHVQAGESHELTSSADDELVLLYFSLNSQEPASFTYS